MKSLRKILTALLVCIAFASCGKNKNAIDSTELLSSVKMNAKKIPFILDFPGWEYRPVVKMSIGNRDYLFLVDTGFTFNFFAPDCDVLKFINSL